MQTLNVLNKPKVPFNSFSLLKRSNENQLSDEKQLLETFQRTIDINDLLKIFSIEAAKHVKFSGLYFQKSGIKIAMSGSRPAKNELKYDIKINNEFIGTLNYAVNKPISAAKHYSLQKLHKCLAYPLRNAIKYYEAMQLAMEDGLTKLGNRRYFDEQLRRAMHQANRHQTHVGLIVADLDKFKPINDTYGHQVGDQILVEFAKSLTLSIRDSDSAFRFGGDEFVIIVEQTSTNDINSLDIIENRIQRALSNNAMLSKYNVGCSLGSTFMTRADNEISLFERADEILYQRKSQPVSSLRLIK